AGRAAARQAARDARREISTKRPDRKSTRLNSSHVEISYAVFCLKKKKKDAAGRSRKVSATPVVSACHARAVASGGLSPRARRPPPCSACRHALSCFFFFKDRGPPPPPPLPPPSPFPS